MALPAIEKKAVLTLFPYLGRNPVIVDVGSNKGEWAELLVPHAKEVHLFEPNEKLLHYTEIKFDAFDNVFYNQFAVSNTSGKKSFYYFDNSYSGLSSLLNNPSWQDLDGRREQMVNVITLDEFIETNIDFLKIDVEGNDFNVLLGAEKLYSEKKIKVTSIEYGHGHWGLINKSFDDLLAFTSAYGYAVYSFNGNDTFNKVTEHKGDENYYIMDAEFTQDWNKEFIKNTQFLKGKINFALEIGAFEGLTSRYICDELLRNKADCRMIVIDPLTDEYLPGHPDNNLFVGQYGRFIRNTKGYPIELMKMTSRQAFKKAGFLDYRFDFIYIDGDHTRDAVFLDGQQAFEVCRVGGHILFDDYGWRTETAEGIDAFLRQKEGKYNLLVKDYQVLIQKHTN